MPGASISRVSASNIVPGQPGNSGPVSSEFNNIINNGVNVNGAAINALETTTATHTSQIATLMNNGWDIEHQTGDFTWDNTHEPLVILDGATLQTVTMDDPATAVPEGINVVIVCENPAGALIESSFFKNTPNTPDGKIHLLPGERAWLLSVGTAGSEQWVWWSQLNNEGMEYIAGTGANYNLSLRERDILYDPVSGTHALQLPAITEPMFGKKFRVQRDVTGFNILTNGDDRFLDGDSSQATGSYFGYLLVATNRASGVGSGYHWALLQLTGI